jgi:hypothetical protein
MEGRGEIDPHELARAFTDLTQWAMESTPREESPIARRIREHLGADPMEQPVVSIELGTYELPNLQVALEAWLADSAREHELIGLPAAMGISRDLAGLVQPAHAGFGGAEPGPVTYKSIAVGERTLTCIENGLVIARDDDGPLAILITSGGDMGPGEALAVETMATTRGQAEQFLSGLRALMHEHNVYRGRVLSLGGGGWDGGAQITVRQLPHIARERIVLPPGVLDRIERHAIGFARHRDRLLAAGRHLKRGLLLHGPPGTGKTLTAMYLSGQMPDRTVLLLAGESLGAIGTACEMARALEPAMVVLEDVDLVAEDREMYDSNPILFELLNQMEGLAEDADVLFVLTTNRAEVLERALALRPGRVDQAVELPLPDPDGRRRLLELYAEGLDVRADALARLVDRTDGVSPAFIRELMRRAALFAAESSAGAIALEDRHLEDALEDLESSRSALTRTLLGARDLQGEDGLGYDPADEGFEPDDVR